MNFLPRFSKHALKMKPLRFIGLKSTKPMITSRFASNGPVKEKPSLKKLMQTYGYSALAVYLGISMIDLPLCFFAVHSLGEERMKVYINRVKRMFGYGKEEQELIAEVRDKIAHKEQKKLSGEEVQNASWWERFKESTLLTEFVIAYGLHKSLIIVRVPLTAAITPATVKALQKWGFNISKFNKSFKTAGESAKIRYKSGDPNDFIKGAQLPKQKSTKGQKWFDGMM